MKKTSMLTIEQIVLIRHGFYSASYFNKTKSLLQSEKDKIVTMQVFPRAPVRCLAGMEEVFEILRKCSGFYSIPEKDANSLFERYLQSREKDVLDHLYLSWSNFTGNLLTIEHREGGDRVEKDEPVMHIKGVYSHFAHLESVYLGVLARATRIASNVREIKGIVSSIDSSPVYFFADRFDRFENQIADGDAALLGGADGVTTHAHGLRRGVGARGSMPHALIASYNGDTVEAALAYAEHFKDESQIIVLVDYGNHCAREAVAVAQAFRDRGIIDRLWGFRLDTSSSLIDESMYEYADDFLHHYSIPPPKMDLHGVNAKLVDMVRLRLRDKGFLTKIMVSGGITPGRIMRWTEHGGQYPDAWGVGSWIINNNPIQFTADIVEVDGRAESKVGREKKQFL